MPITGSTDYTDDLRLAHVLADDADSLTQARFKALDLHVMSKPDLTPVTDADKAVEEGIRRTLSRVRSRDAVIGEEQGTTGHSQRRWIVDPIDGTKNYVRGVPVWATLIALAVDDEVVLGVVSAPQLQRRWWASVGNGAWTGRSLLKATKCEVSDVRRLEDASLSYSSLSGWDERDRLDDFVSLSRRCWRTRAYGDFWSYMLLAEGAVDIAAEPELEVYDMAALDVIVREAGGRFTSLDGTDGPWGGNALASNGHLHDAALSFLGAMDDDGTDPDVPRRRAGLGQQPARPAGPSGARLRRVVRPCPSLSGLATVTSHQFCGTRGGTMKIKDVIQHKGNQAVVTIGPEATVRELVALLAEHNVGALVVSEDGERVAGIVSERDVVRRLHQDATVLDHAVSSIMTAEVRTCAGDDGLTELMQTMTEHRIRHVPVVADGRLTGIISIGDVVKNRIGELEFERDQLDHYVHQT